MHHLGIFCRKMKIPHLASLASIVQALFKENAQNGSDQKKLESP